MPKPHEWTSSTPDLAIPQPGVLTQDPLLSGLDAEERANQITHGLGFLLSLPAGLEIIRLALTAGDPRVSIGGIVYAISLIALYAASTLSHSFSLGKTRDFFRLVDQVCIYLLIAGTVTPIALAYWPGWMLATLFVGTWLVALIGVYRKICIEGPNRVTLWVYVALGWFPAMGIWPVISQMPFLGGATLVFGGLCYTGGVYFWLREGRIPYSHAVWHLCVLVGTMAHFAIVRWFVMENSPLAG